ncbi:MAG: hypothetical protein HC786_07875 [Richelia sp. CSU_2_1]|nr:hypothetical protein [Richelia sp. CSU_2_1]
MTSITRSLRSESLAVPVSVTIDYPKNHQLSMLAIAQIFDRKYHTRIAGSLLPAKTFFTN